MKKFLQILFSVLICHSMVFSQTNFDFRKFVSPDGMYIKFEEANTIISAQPITRIQKLGSSWRKEYPGRIPFAFSADSKLAIGKAGDTLYIQQLGSDKLDVVRSVKSYKTGVDKKGNRLLAYHLNNNELVVQFNNRQIQRIKSVQFYQITPDQQGIAIIQSPVSSENKNNKVLIIRENLEKQYWTGTEQDIQINLSKFNEGIYLSAKRKVGNDDVQVLQYCDGKDAKLVWSGIASVVSIVENEFSHAICFMTESSGKNSLRELHYWKIGERVSNILLADTTRSIKGRYSFTTHKNAKFQFPFGSKDHYGFVSKGESILVYLNKSLMEPGKEAKTKSKDIDLWSYFDPVFKTSQLAEDKNLQLYAAIINTKTGKLSFVEKENEQIISAGGVNNETKVTEEYALLLQFDHDVLDRSTTNYTLGPKSNNYKDYEFNWNTSFMMRIYAVSLKDGSRILIRDKFRPYYTGHPSIAFSPDSKFGVYYDAEQDNYFSYEFGTGKSRKLSNISGLSFRNNEKLFGDAIRDQMGPNSKMYFANEKHVLVKDTNSDFWELSLDGIERPRNLTNGLCKKNGAYLTGIHLLGNDNNFLFEVRYLLNDGLRGYKNPGYFTLSMPDGKLDQLIPLGTDTLFTSLKKVGNGYVLEMEKSNQPPRLVYTKDFKTYSPITTEYNRSNLKIIQKELLTWKTFDGKYCQGLLYKPIGFDATKRNPVVVHFYERKRVDTYADIFFTGHSEIDLFLDNGYLVFVPDIFHEESGQTCFSAYNCVVSGTEFLKKKQYVDGKKIGMYGHSFGGYQVNCIATQTNIFAAAVSSSGYSDMISSYLGDIFNLPGVKVHNRNGEGAAEVGQNRMGTTPWKAREVYIQNSPVFFADKVTCPVLLMSSKNDDNVPYEQSVEMYKALRRCGKKVWLVSGDKGEHGGPSVRKEFMLHFFDYYLKGLPPRTWITRGIPARMKGIEDGYDIDTEIAAPPLPTFYERELITPSQERLYKRIKTGKYPWHKE